MILVDDDECCDGCLQPLYDTGCDAPGCDGFTCHSCDTGCDREDDPDTGRCAIAVINRDRAAAGLPPIEDAYLDPDELMLGRPIVDVYLPDLTHQET